MGPVLGLRCWQLQQLAADMKVSGEVSSIEAHASRW